MLGLFTESCSKTYLDQITESDLQAFIRFLRKKFNGPKGARTVYNCFQGINTFLRVYKIMIAGPLLGKLTYDENSTAFQILGTCLIVRSASCAIAT